ncbi:uncharacterized protein LOC142326673 isoform X2 [Lycorma delicatula]|uniref:uncharacterized protein LOC142326673 isoform X2 n=1 Tax=Lycorma delicatula TaxID=130591 RepID=UPI003F5158CA
MACDMQFNLDPRVCGHSCLTISYTLFILFWCLMTFIIDLGTAALTSRQLKENDFVKVVNFLDEAVTIASDVQKETGKKDIRCGRTL